MYVDNIAAILCRASSLELEGLIANAALCADDAADACKNGHRNEIERSLRVSAHCMRVLSAAVQSTEACVDTEIRVQLLECAGFVLRTMSLASQHVGRRFKAGGHWNMDALMLECDVQTVAWHANLLEIILGGSP